MRHTCAFRFGVAVLLCAAGAIVSAQETAPAAPPPAAGAGSADLAKQLANPVASLVSVPFQANWDTGVGPGEDTRFILNFQPVMPFSLNKDWNLIARVIAPLIGQPALVPGGEPTSGLGDILVSGFFSPAQPKKFIWGVGPALQLPATADNVLGAQKWAAGPTFVVLKQVGPWTVGALANQLWSYAGDDSRPAVNQTFLQPFVAYGTKGGVTFTLNTESSANWEADSGQRWTVPINLQVTKVVKLGRKPMSVGMGGGYYVTQPDGGPAWKIRTILTLLFPKG